MPDDAIAPHGGKLVDLMASETERERWDREASSLSSLTMDARDRANLEMLAAYCFEFLIHAIQVEGRQQGIDERLVTLLGDTTPLPTTYAGGVRSMEDVDQIESLGQGRLDYTVGSALDLFGGSGVKYEDLIERHRS